MIKVYVAKLVKIDSGNCTLGTPPPPLPLLPRALSSTEKFSSWKAVRRILEIVRN